MEFLFNLHKSFKAGLSRSIIGLKKIVTKPVHTKKENWPL